MAPDICLLYRQKALLWLTPTFAFSSPVRPFEPYYRDRGRQVNRGATAVSSLPTTLLPTPARGVPAPGLLERLLQTSLMEGA